MSIGQFITHFCVLLNADKILGQFSGESRIRSTQYRLYRLFKAYNEYCCGDIISNDFKLCPEASDSKFILSSRQYFLIFYNSCKKIPIL